MARVRDPLVKSFRLRASSFTETAATVAILLAAAALVGWATDSTTLKSLSPGLVSMKPNEAVAFLFAGYALWLLRWESVDPGRRSVAHVCAWTSFLIGAVTLLEYLLRWGPGIDQLLFREAGDTAWTSHPGRMAPTAAFNFVLLGVALLRLDVRGAFWGVQLFALAAIVISLLAHLAFLYALELLHGTGYYTHISVQSAAAFCFLAGGILFSRPERGLVGVVASETTGGRVARGLLPVAIAAPIVLAWIPVIGARGGYYGEMFGVALLTAASIVTLTGFVLWSARSIHQADLERSRAGEALRQNEEKFRLLVQGAPDYAIIMLDPKGRVVSWNPGAQRISGYRAEEIIGEHFSKLYFPEDAKRGRPERALRIATERGRFEAEGWRRRKDGSRFWANVVITPLSGEVFRGFCKITRDITERRKVEKRLRDTNTELRSREQALQEALDSLTETHEALKQTQLQLIQAEKMESIGRLAAGVAHEVKNPLAILQSGADYLARGHNGDPENAEVLGEIGRAIERADRIIGGLLDFSAPRQLELHAEDANGMVDQALLLLKHELERRHVDVVRELAPNLPRIEVDQAKIEQVLVNVLLNACQAMPDGGTVTIRTRLATAADVAFAGESYRGDTADWVVFEIDDTGEGIPEGQLGKVFDPFFTAKEAGTGLGLAVTKTIIDMHRGLIRLRNRPEGGVAVRIVLRCERSDLHGQEMASADRRRRGGFHEDPPAQPRGDGRLRGTDRERRQPGARGGEGVSAGSDRARHHHARDGRG